ncbi:hypothetical protein XELAEV_18013554mg [Xenopus laevis]|uniref:Uncharacterized protein n=1 Tax=Xenopus laevis TaxID=8355 RepID=A0A974DPL6_XENLA|nr:hypothetical protein XELAEV_18013554mg [Xenopus laevis]
MHMAIFSHILHRFSFFHSWKCCIYVAILPLFYWKCCDLIPRLVPQGGLVPGLARASACFCVYPSKTLSKPKYRYRVDFSTKMHTTL